VNLGQILADRGIVDIRSVVRRPEPCRRARRVERQGQVVLVGDSGTSRADGDGEREHRGELRRRRGDQRRRRAAQSGDVDAGRDVAFTSTDRTRDSVVETGSNIRVVAERGGTCNRI
jgi:hypothetical protein